MRLEKINEKELNFKILGIIGKYLDLNQYKIFYFGSRVAGGGGERSDIDIGIEGKNEVPFAAMAKIKEEIEESEILYKIDFVDFKRVSPEFKKMAMEKIKIINDK